MQRVVAAVIERELRVLVCRRPQHKQHGGLWEFPGGKCNDGEGDAEAISRELEEELGVRVTIVGDPLLIVTDSATRYEIVFLPVECEGEFELREHEAMRWLASGELESVPLAPSDAIFGRWWSATDHP